MLEVRHKFFRYITLDTTGVDTIVKKLIVYVDATSGTIFDEYNPELHGYHQTADQWTWYYGQKFDEMSTYKCSACTRFSLEDRNRKIYTLKSSGQFFENFRDQNNNWVETDKKTGAQAHWALTFTRDYYYNKLYVPAGANIRKLKVICNQATDGPASFIPDDKRPIIRVGFDNTGGYTSAAAEDVLAHEYTHMFISETCKLESGGPSSSQESAALNEGFSDIMGM